MARPHRTTCIAGGAAQHPASLCFIRFTRFTRFIRFLCQQTRDPTGARSTVRPPDRVTPGPPCITSCRKAGLGFLVTNDDPEACSGFRSTTGRFPKAPRAIPSSTSHRMACSDLLNTTSGQKASGGLRQLHRPCRPSQECWLSKDVPKQQQHQPSGDALKHRRLRLPSEGSHQPSEDGPEHSQHHHQ